MKWKLHAEPGKNSQQPRMIEGYENMPFDLTNIYQCADVIDIPGKIYNGRSNSKLSCLKVDFSINLEI